MLKLQIDYNITHFAPSYPKIFSGERGEVLTYHFEKRMFQVLSAYKNSMKKFNGCLVTAIQTVTESFYTAWEMVYRSSLCYRVPSCQSYSSAGYWGSINQYKDTSGIRVTYALWCPLVTQEVPVKSLELLVRAMSGVV